MPANPLSTQKEPCTALALSTISNKKQAIIFVNMKRSAEKQAELIAHKLKPTKEGLELSKKILAIIPTPTVQCGRLAGSIKTGIAFHHSGLHPKQREIIESAFRLGHISIICATPTLAAGVDLPAYRVIVKDLHRYDNGEMAPISVLEYFQMIGRAGRPSFDNKGEGICIAKSEANKEDIYYKYLLGVPEDITSKLAAEPVLRTYLLSLIAMDVVHTKEDITSFFNKTFWAHQYDDVEALNSIIEKQLSKLVEWGMLIEKGKPKRDSFISASELTSLTYEATPLGRRVAELYLDPYSANQFVQSFDRIHKDVNVFSWVHLISMALEMPKLKVKSREWEDIIEKSEQFRANYLIKEPAMYDHDYELFMNSVKTAMFINDWMDESDEQRLLETYDARPGDTRNMIHIGEWLLRCVSEIARILKKVEIISIVNKARFRLKYGVKEELLPLVKFKGIGRVKARRLFARSIRDTAAIKRVDLSTLSQLVGYRTAANLKQQVGETVTVPLVSKRRGQMNLMKFGE